MWTKALILFILLCLAPPILAQDVGLAGSEATTQNAPATSQSQPGTGRTPFAAPGAPQPSFVDTSSWWRAIVDAQRVLQQKMTATLRTLKAGTATDAALFLIGVSFLYGIFHAAGPGHGKAVISSYMLANKTTLRRGISISVLAAMVQACSAVILVGVLVLILRSTGLEIRQMVHRLEMISALLIAGAGLLFLIVHVRRQFIAKPVLCVSHGSCIAGHSDMPDPRMLEKKLALRELIAIIIAVGIRPCTGAIVVLLFSLRLDVLWAGVISAFVMAAGTAITVSALAALAVGSRDIAARFVGSRWTDRFYNYATIAACLLVMSVGAGLFWQSLGSVQPF